MCYYMNFEPDTPALDSMFLLPHGSLPFRVAQLAACRGQAHPSPWSMQERGGEDRTTGRWEDTKEVPNVATTIFEVVLLCVWVSDCHLTPWPLNSNPFGDL